VVVHACNPSFFGSRDRRIMVWGQPGQNCKTLLKKTN
jgi:hypothetical protein